MALLPDTSSAPNGTTIQVSTQETYPNKTYKMRIEEERIEGNITDELDAVRQAVYKILNTERYRYVIYDWNYGVELDELFGKPIPYVLPEIPRRIREALVQDDRISDVINFDLTYTKDGNVTAKFTVVTIYGDLEAEKEVRVRV